MTTPQEQLVQTNNTSEPAGPNLEIFAQLAPLYLDVDAQLTENNFQYNVARQDYVKRDKKYGKFNGILAAGTLGFIVSIGLQATAGEITDPASTTADRYADYIIETGSGISAECNKFRGDLGENLANEFENYSQIRETARRMMLSLADESVDSGTCTPTVTFQYSQDMQLREVVSQDIGSYESIHDEVFSTVGAKIYAMNTYNRNTFGGLILAPLMLAGAVIGSRVSGRKSNEEFYKMYPRERCIPQDPYQDVLFTIGNTRLEQ